MYKTEPPRFDGTLRKHALRVPEVIRQCSGIVVFGRRIKSLAFTTDLSILRNMNADAILAVYPFTPQPIINQALIMASDIPVFTGVGGGITTGARSVALAGYSEMQGASGVVLNAPTDPAVIQLASEKLDIPVVVTVVQWNDRARQQVQAGAAILNVAAGDKTPAVVRDIRKEYPQIPIMASGGPTDETIQATIAAGSNAITWTPPSNKELFATIMRSYREGTAQL